MLDFLKKNLSLKGRHAGRRCFIVASGPSLQEQDLLRLKGEVVIVVNSFYHHPDVDELNPPYWLLADPGYWEQPDLDLWPLLRAINEKGLSPTLFLPSGAAPFFSRSNFGLNLNVHFFHFDYSQDASQPIDFCSGLPPFGQNVVSPALMLAYFLGCNPIYLLGCDHTWWRYTEESYQSEQYSRFYGDANQNEPSIQEAFEFKELQRTIVVQRDQYEKLSEYGKARGIKVFNATKGGELDLFPRVDYEEIFASTEPAFEALPPSPRALRSSALISMKRGDFAAALVLLERALEENRDRVLTQGDLDSLRAVCLASLGLKRAAIEAARQDLFSASSEDTPDLLRRIQEGALENWEQNYEAREIDHFEGERADEVALLNQQGEDFFLKGNQREASRLFYMALELDDDSSLTHNNLGVFWWQVGENAKAIPHFKRAIDCDPNNADALSNYEEIRKAENAPD